MRRLRWSSWALAFLILSAIASPAAAEAPPRRLSLGQAISIALRSNRTIRAATLQAEAATSQVGVARGAMLPRLDAMENYSATDNPVLVFSDLLLQQDFAKSNFALSNLNYPGTYSNFQSQIQLSFPVYAGGRLLAGLRAAKFGAESERWREVLTREQTAFGVIRSYYSSVLAENRLEVVERALSAAQAHLKEADDLYKKGMAISSDVLRTKVMSGGLQEQRTDATSRMEISWAALAHVLGDEDERLAPLPLAINSPIVDRYSSARLDDLRQEAVAARPEIKIALAGVRQAEQEVKIARADYLPTMNLATTYENDSKALTRAGNNFAVFAYARLNLFNGLATKSKVDAAMAKLERARTLADDVRHGVELEVESAYRTLEAARQNVEVARQNYSYASDALRILEDRYQSGLATNVAVLDAQAARQQADMERVSARIALMVDSAALELALGKMPAAE
jgi:outer membrane protein